MYNVCQYESVVVNGAGSLRKSVSAPKSDRMKHAFVSCTLPSLVPYETPLMYPPSCARCRCIHRNALDGLRSSKSHREAGKVSGAG